MTYLPFINTLAYVPVLNGGGVVAVGQMLKDKGLTFDYAFTSVLSRAIKTLFYIQDTMGLHWVPVVRDYRSMSAITALCRDSTSPKRRQNTARSKWRSFRSL